MSNAIKRCSRGVNASLLKKHASASPNSRKRNSNVWQSTFKRKSRIRFSKNGSNLVWLSCAKKWSRRKSRLTSNACRMRTNARKKRIIAWWQRFATTNGMRRKLRKLATAKHLKKCTGDKSRFKKRRRDAHVLTKSMKWRATVVTVGRSCLLMVWTKIWRSLKWTFPALEVAANREQAVPKETELHYVNSESTTFSHNQKSNYDKAIKLDTSHVR